MSASMPTLAAIGVIAGLVMPVPALAQAAAASAAPLPPVGIAPPNVRSGAAS